MPYFKFSRDSGGKAVTCTVRLEDLGGWTVARQAVLGAADSYGQLPRAGETGRLEVSFISPIGGDRVALTPDQSDAFLRMVAQAEIHDLDAAAS